MKTIVALEKVNIEEVGCHLLLNVTMDNSLIRLVLDTGASRTVIDANFYQEKNPSKELIKEADQSVGVGSSQLDSFLVKIDKFELGIIKLENIEIALMDLSNVSLTYHNLGIGKVHGVLGGDILDLLNGSICYKTLRLMLNG